MVADLLGDCEFILGNRSEILYFALAVGFKFDGYYWSRGVAIRGQEFTVAVAGYIAEMCKIPFLAFVVLERFTRAKWSVVDDSDLQPLSNLISQWKERNQDQIDQWPVEFMKEMSETMLQTARGMDWAPGANPLTEAEFV